MLLWPLLLYFPYPVKVVPPPVLAADIPTLPLVPMLLPNYLPSCSTSLSNTDPFGLFLSKSSHGFSFSSFAVALSSGSQHSILFINYQKEFPVFIYYAFWNCIREIPLEGYQVFISTSASGLALFDSSRNVGTR